jgi:phospholipid-binding lipoprotein MlaA
MNSYTHIWRPCVFLGIFSLNLLLWGCATTTTPGEAPKSAGKPLITDPFEPFNRTMYGFNKGVDTVLVKPVAKGYNVVVPPSVRDGVWNFFANIEEVSVFLNTLLQARFTDAGITLGRFTINSTIGVLGIFDVAADKWDITEKQADFGQTLYSWGIKRSAYLVMPILGPSTVRDTMGKAPDYLFSVWDFAPWEVQIAAYGLMAVSLRASYLDEEEYLQSAFDEYAFVRDIYIQQRVALLKGREDVTDWDEDLINEHTY